MFLSVETHKSTHFTPSKSKKLLMTYKALNGSGLLLSFWLVLNPLCHTHLAPAILLSLHFFNRPDMLPSKFSLLHWFFLLPGMLPVFSQRFSWLSPSPFTFKSLLKYQPSKLDFPLSPYLKLPPPRALNYVTFTTFFKNVP